MWLPGTEFKRKALRIYAMRLQYATQTYQSVTEKVVSGIISLLVSISNIQFSELILSTIRRTSHDFWSSKAVQTCLLKMRS